MLQDYLRSTVRNTRKHKLFAFIMITGLALGLAVFFTIALYIRTELSYDRHWDDAERIYQVGSILESRGGESQAPFFNTPYILGTTAMAQFPTEVEQWFRTYTLSSNVLIDEESVRANVMLAEPHLLEVLQLETVSGDMAQVLTSANSLAVNENYANQQFGEQSPLGRRIVVVVEGLGRVEYTIEAVFGNGGQTSLYQLGNFIGLFDPAAIPESAGAQDSWDYSSEFKRRPLQVINLVKMAEGVDATRVETDLRAYMDENKLMGTEFNKTRFRFMRLQDEHLYSTRGGSGSSVYRLQVFAAIGALVLIIGGCNFVMLTTVKAADRLREVGVRKAVGGTVRQLMHQYLLDAFVYTLLAAAFAVALVELVKPSLQNSVGITLASFPLWQNLLFFSCSVVLFALLSGAYPAFLLAQGRPGILLRNGGASVVSKGNGLRKVLVGLQFAVVIALLLASAVVYRQIEYTRNRSPGFKLDDIVRVMAFEANAMEKIQTVANEFRVVEGVEAVVVGGKMAGISFLSAPTLFSAGMDGGEKREAGLSFAPAGYGFFDLLGVDILGGREFSPDTDFVYDLNAQPADGTTREMKKILLNRSAARALGFAAPEDAVNEILDADLPGAGGKLVKVLHRVIGVVEDTQFTSIMRPPVAEFYQLTTTDPMIAVRLQPGVSFDTVREQLQQRWHAVVGDAQFNASYASGQLGNPLRREENEARIIVWCTALALVIACTGLYSLVAATALKRVKEIGVRKAMGAGRGSLIAMLLWQFSKPVFWANLMALPLGFWAVKQWLQRFPYQLDTNVIVITGIVAGIVALLISWLTVSFIAARAASAKPALALKYE